MIMSNDIIINCGVRSAGLGAGTGSDPSILHQPMTGCTHVCCAARTSMRGNGAGVPREDLLLILFPPLPDSLSPSPHPPPLPLTHRFGFSIPSCTLMCFWEGGRGGSQHNPPPLTFFTRNLLHPSWGLVRSPLLSGSQCIPLGVVI